MGNKESAFVLEPIGVVRSPYREKGDAPHQGRFSQDVCLIEVFPKFEPALKDVETCSHLVVLYWFDRARRDVLLTRTPHGPKEHGVFATRSPNRPNPIGFSVVKLLERRGAKLRVLGLDALDGTLVLDIKPYSSEIDSVSEARIGWFEEARREKGKSR